MGKVDTSRTFHLYRKRRGEVLGVSSQGLDSGDFQSVSSTQEERGDVIEASSIQNEWLTRPGSFNFTNVPEGCTTYGTLKYLSLMGPQVTHKN